MFFFRQYLFYGVWHIEKKQRYMFEVKIDDKQVFYEENKIARIFENVSIYAADPWHQSAKGVMTNFEVKASDSAGKR
jgi:hypothetical protein